MKSTFVIAVFSFTITLYCVFAQNNPKLNDEFFTAVKAGNESKVEHLIEEGVNVNITDENGMTALHLAASKGYKTIANLLIENGADVNAKSEFGYNTALCWAAEGGHKNVVKLLIRNGADINAKCENNNTPLHLAVQEDHEKVVELLTRNGANVNVININQYTPLLYATRDGAFKVKIAEILIKNGADVNIYEQYELVTPLYMAAWHGLEKSVELLLNNGADINALTKSGKTALHRAAASGHLKVVELLVRKNAPITVKDGDGKTPIDLADGREIADILKENRPTNKACRIYESTVFKNSSNALGIRILGGDDAFPGEFPWMAALGYLTPAYKISFDCGGTIISDEFIVTAAHCVSQRVPVVVRLGTLFLTDDSATDTLNRQYKEIIKHPNYSPSKKKNDIALIRLAERIVFTEFIKPACLQTDLSDENPDVNLVVTGWGVTSTGNKQKSDVLLETELKTMPLIECNTTLTNYNTQGTAPNLPSLRNGIDQSQYCAYDPNFKKDSCWGDSGGPLQLISDDSHLAKVIGVVSFGIECGVPLPSIYTRIAHYIDWIEPHVWPNENVAIPLVNLTMT